MVHCHTVHLALGTLLIPCTMCGTGALLPPRPPLASCTLASEDLAELAVQFWVARGALPHRAPFTRCTAESMHHVWHRFPTLSLAALAAQALNLSTPASELERCERDYLRERLGDARVDGGMLLDVSTPNAFMRRMAPLTERIGKGWMQGHTWCTATQCTFPSVHC